MYMYMYLYGDSLSTACGGERADCVCACACFCSCTVLTHFKKLSEKCPSTSCGKQCQAPCREEYKLSGAAWPGGAVSSTSTLLSVLARKSFVSSKLRFFVV